MKRITSLNSLIFTLMLLVSTISYSQTVLNPSNGCAPADPNANCTSNSVDILGAYIGLIDGTELTDSNIPAGNADAYVFIDVKKNGNKFDLFAQFDLIEYSTDGTQTSSFISISFRVVILTLQVFICFSF